MKRLILSLIIFSSLGLFAQRVAIEKGDISFDSYEYGQAIRFYNDALDKKDTKPEVKQYLFGQLGLCYANLFQYTKAEEYFGMVTDTGAQVKPEVYKEYGIVLKLNGKYTEARNQFIKYQQVSSSTEAGLYVQSVEWAMNNTVIANNSYRIFPTNLDVSGQSLGYCYYGSGLIYCHGRNKVSDNNKKVLFDIDYAINESSLEFTDRKNFFSKINFEWNELSPSITTDESRMYFAANATRLKNKKVKGKLELNKSGIAHYKIYVATKRDAEFQDITELPFNSRDYSCMHPCITNEGKTLLFSSDKPGGYGGFDLYRSTLSKDSIWGEPVNLGPVVNSAENEIFPWVSGNLLFFSSKGFNGYGGYDVFIAGLNTEGMPENLKNIGLPINSFRDDVAYITNDSGGSGYFSSNRNTDNGADQVYYFKESQSGKLLFNSVNALIGKSPLQVSLQDSIGYTPLKSVANVQMMNYPQTLVPEDEIPTKTTDDKHKKAPAPTTVESVKSPPVVAPAITGMAVAIGIPRDTVKRQEKPRAVASEPARKPQAAVLPKPVQEFPPLLFKFDEASITAAQKVTADSLVILFGKNKSQKIQIAAFTDSRGSASYNIGLSQRRASSVKHYLIQKGIPAGKITTKGFGESELLNECADGVNCSEEQHAINRRVVMVLIAE